MKIDGGLRGYLPEELPAVAAEMEEMGRDGVWMPEVNHDAFLPLGAIANATSRVTIGTAIALAFARNPMQLAYIGNDLQAVSQGRFVLGLGSQVRAHVTRRFSMPWSHPAARMREYVSAIQAIWHSWETGDQLDFQGDFYSHTLMPKEFSPGPSKYPKAPIYIAAVGPKMTQVAGEVADGVFIHSFMNRRYMREAALPMLAKSLADSGRSRTDFTIVGMQFVVTGSTEEKFAASKEAIRRRVAWYGSTPAYRPVLAIHGWSELGDQLHRLSISKEPDFLERMDALVDDEVLETFAVIAEPQDLAAAIRARVGDSFDRIRLNQMDITSEQLAAVVADLKA